MLKGSMADLTNMAGLTLWYGLGFSDGSSDGLMDFRLDHWKEKEKGEKHPFCEGRDKNALIKSHLGNADSINEKGRKGKNRLDCKQLDIAVINLANRTIHSLIEIEESGAAFADLAGNVDGVHRGQGIKIKSDEEWETWEVTTKTKLLLLVRAERTTIRNRLPDDEAWIRKKAKYLTAPDTNECIQDIRLRPVSLTEDGPQGLIESLQELLGDLWQCKGKKLEELRQRLKEWPRSKQEDNTNHRLSEFLTYHFRQSELYRTKPRGAIKKMARDMGISAAEFRMRFAGRGANTRPDVIRSMAKCLKFPLVEYYQGPLALFNPDDILDFIKKRPHLFDAKKLKGILEALPIEEKRT